MVKTVFLGVRTRYLDQHMKNQTQGYWGGGCVSLFGELVVDEITTKLHLPFCEGKFCLIYKFHLPHTPQMRPPRDSNFAEFPLRNEVSSCHNFMFY